jgi:hypothetical protein
MSVAGGDSVAAIQELELFVQKNQLNAEINVLLANLYLGIRDYTKCNEFLYPLVNDNGLNFLSSDYWRLYAYTQLNLSNPDGAGRSALRAISLLHDEQQSEALAKEFAEEIRLAIELNPELLVK